MEPFWKTKTLEEMTQDEWESLCDGCGRCCLHKLRDDDTNELVLHQRRLPAAGPELLPLQRLRAPPAPGAGLRQPDPAGCRRSTGCRRPAPIAACAMARTWRGGIRWCPAIRRPCMRPAFRCAAGRSANARRAAGRSYRRLAGTHAPRARRKPSRAEGNELDAERLPCSAA